MSYFIVFLPLFGAIFGYSSKSLGDRYVEVITTSFLFLSAILSIVIFLLGVVGIFLNRKNVIVILMSVELILLSVNINLVAFSTYSNEIAGQIFTFFILTVAAAEAAIGLAIIVSYHRNKGSIRVQDINEMKG